VTTVEITGLYWHFRGRRLDRDLYCGLPHPMTEQSHPTAGTYLRIGAVLVILTVLEVGVFYVPAFRAVLVPVLLVLSAAKFTLVVMVLHAPERRQQVLDLPVRRSPVARGRRDGPPCYSSSWVPSRSGVRRAPDDAPRACPAALAAVGPASERRHRARRAGRALCVLGWAQGAASSCGVVRRGSDGAGPRPQRALHNLSDSYLFSAHMVQHLVLHAGVPAAPALWNARVGGPAAARAPLGVPVRAPGHAPARRRRAVLRHRSRYGTSRNSTRRRSSTIRCTSCSTSSSSPPR